MWSIDVLRAHCSLQLMFSWWWCVLNCASLVLYSGMVVVIDCAHWHVWALLVPGLLTKAVCGVALCALARCFLCTGAVNCDCLLDLAVGVVFACAQWQWRLLFLLTCLRVVVLIFLLGSAATYNGLCGALGAPADASLGCAWCNCPHLGAANGLL